MLQHDIDFPLKQHKMDGEKCHRKTHKNYGKPVRFLTVPIKAIYEKNNYVLSAILKLKNY